MSTLAVGVSNPPDLVKNVQHLLNEAFNSSVVEETGDYDEKTEDAVSRFQTVAGLAQSGKVDANTLQVIYWASKTPIHQLTYKGKTFSLNDPEYKTASKRLIQKSEAQTRWYVRMADNVQGLWKEHNQVRGSNLFWSFVVDTVVGTTFPPAGTIDAAVKAAAAIAAAAKSDDFNAYVEAVKDGSDKIRAANAAMNQYQDELFTGGAKLVDELEDLKSACVVTLEISAAFATAGTSTAVTAAVMGGVGSYKALLSEVDKASVKPDVKVEDAFANIVKAGVIDATVGAIMKGKGDAIAEAVAKKVAGAALKKVGSEAVAHFIEAALTGALKTGAEGAIKDLLKVFNPKDKMTFDKFVENLGTNLAKGAFLGQVDAILGGITKNAGKVFSPGDFFKGLGKVDLDKALKAGGLKIIEQAYDKYVESALEKANGDKSKIEPQLKDSISSDPAVQKWFSDYEKKQGKK